jgi:hypothetical protein
MIHVATIHWRSERWIDVQLRYLERFLPAPYRVYAWLNEIPGDHTGKFFYATSERLKQHPTKLNLLGDMIGFAAESPSDLVLFLDGDAFPVAPIEGLVADRLERHRLIAVQRHENNGDLQPHPCFCITTVGFWQEIGGDWQRGYEWQDAVTGERTTDVGGNLLGILDAAGVDWYPLRRVNTVDDHPLLFALYGDAEHGPIVYHHGAGFRPTRGGRVSMLEHTHLHTKVLTRALDTLPRGGRLEGVRRRYHPVVRQVEAMQKETAELGDEILLEIERDEGFWHRFA